MKRHLLTIVLLAFAGIFAASNAQSLTLTIIETHKDGETSISYDDGEYEGDSIDKVNDDDLDMGWEGEDLNVMTAYTRFQNVTIPQGTPIDSAVLIIYAHEDESAPAYITVYAEANDDSPMFEEDEALSDRTMTSASVAWDCVDDWTMWQPYHSPNLAALIQEVVSRPGWVSGNSLTLFMKGQDQGASLLDNGRDFESYENIEDPDDGGDGLHHPERIPTLKIFWGGVTSSLDASANTRDQFSIYPNPATDILHIHPVKTGAFSVSIFSMSGQVVMQSENNKTAAVLDISELDAGIYFLETLQAGQRTNRKVIIK
jgi:hypothetical protein